MRVRCWLVLVLVISPILTATQPTMASPVDRLEPIWWVPAPPGSYSVIADSAGTVMTGNRGDVWATEPIGGSQWRAVVAAGDESCMTLPAMDDELVVVPVDSIAWSPSIGGRGRSVATSPRRTFSPWRSGARLRFHILLPSSRPTKCRLSPASTARSSRPQDRRSVWTASTAAPRRLVPHAGGSLLLGRLRELRPYLSRGVRHAGLVCGHR